MSMRERLLQFKKVAEANKPKPVEYNCVEKTAPKKKGRKKGRSNKTLMNDAAGKRAARRIAKERHMSPKLAGSLAQAGCLPGFTEAKKEELEKLKKLDQ